MSFLASIQFFLGGKGGLLYSLSQSAFTLEKACFQHCFMVMFKTQHLLLTRDILRLLIIRCSITKMYKKVVILFGD